MKCPKCGYNSFEIHDMCKKCASDLTSYKGIHGLKSIVLPLETRTIMSEKLMAEKVNDIPVAVVDTPTDMFSFDVPVVDKTPNAGSFLTDDPFDFDNDAVSASPREVDFSIDKVQMSAQSKAEEVAFSDLLASSIKDKGGTPSTLRPAETNTQVGSELNDFIWDDTPAIAPGEVIPPLGDDFNSLFGDTDNTVKK